MPKTTVIQTRVAELMELHGGLKKAAKAVGCAPYTLARLRNDAGALISDGLLEKIGMKRVITYKRAE